MRHVLPFAAALLPMPALAHTGHLGELAGHDHWVAGAAIGIAAGIALWQGIRDRRGRRGDGDAPQAADAEARPDGQEA